MQSFRLVVCLCSSVEILMYRGRTFFLGGDYWRNFASPRDRVWRPGSGRPAVQSLASGSCRWSERQRSGGSQQQRVWTRMSGPSSWIHRCIVSSSQMCVSASVSVCCKCCMIHSCLMQLFLSEVCSRDYPMMLSVFSKLLTKESDLRVIDNLCAALCRMIMSNIDAVPLEQVHLKLTTSSLFY